MPNYWDTRRATLLLHGWKQLYKKGEEWQRGDGTTGIMPQEIWASPPYTTGFATTHSLTQAWAQHEANTRWQNYDEQTKRSHS